MSTDSKKDMQPRYADWQYEMVISRQDYCFVSTKTPAAGHSHTACLAANPLAVDQ